MFSERLPILMTLWLTSIRLSESRWHVFDIFTHDRPNLFKRLPDEFYTGQVIRIVEPPETYQWQSYRDVEGKKVAVWNTEVSLVVVWENQQPTKTFYMTCASKKNENPKHEADEAVLYRAIMFIANSGDGAAYDAIKTMDVNSCDQKILLSITITSQHDWKSTIMIVDRNGHCKGEEYLKSDNILVPFDNCSPDAEIGHEQPGYVNGWKRVETPKDLIRT